MAMRNAGPALRSRAQRRRITRVFKTRSVRRQALTRFVTARGGDSHTSGFICQSDEFGTAISSFLQPGEAR